MADKSIMEEMLPMKISNWESIPYSEGINCPNENCDNKSYDDARNIIGWCDIPYGYMMVCECKKCFTKYRFHGTTEINLIFIISHSHLCCVLNLKQGSNYGNKFDKEK